MKTELVNLSFYQFMPLGERPALEEIQAELRITCADLELKGTILLASEGINAMLTGSRESIDTFKQIMHSKMKIASKLFKEAEVPAATAFPRMLVKIKKEIITVGDPTVEPHAKTARRLSPKELQKWLEENREMVLLDTRNDYEYEVGTFRGAIELGLDSSREFTAKATKKIVEWKDKPVVTFCTGGIRCEKASAVLLKMGLQDVYQLDGGIIKYFEETGGTHFEGKCFVFDWRLAVDGKMNPTERSADPGKKFGRHRRGNE